LKTFGLADQAQFPSGSAALGFCNGRAITAEQGLFEFSTIFTTLGVLLGETISTDFLWVEVALI
jgi:hypothetical protein